MGRERHARHRRFGGGTMNPLKVGDVFTVDGIGLVAVMHGQEADKPMQIEMSDGDVWVGVTTIDGTAVIVNENDLKKATVQ